MKRRSVDKRLTRKNRKKGQRRTQERIAMKFKLGQIVATPGDWGKLDAMDKEQNEHALEHGWRILSNFENESGDRLYIITEADRSVTTLLLPEEY